MGQAWDGWRSRVLLAVCMVVGCAPAVVRADWRDFVPRPFRNQAFVDLFSSYERDHRSNVTTIQWYDTFIRQKLTLISDGYSYHPRFLLYHFSISGAVKEEDYEASYYPQLGWKSETGLDYDITLLFLPEHPYHLDLFSRRFEPVYKQQAAVQFNSTETSNGASFRYRKKPYFFHTSFTDDSIDSSTSNSDVRNVYVDGQYFKRFESGPELSFTGTYHPSWFSNSLGTSGNASEYLLGNFLNAWRARLTSNLSKNTSDQENLLSSFNYDQWAWYEQLSVYLPWNFRSDTAYRYQNSDNTVTDLNQAPTKLSNTTKDLQYTLVNRLYESVDTTYNFLHNSQSSPDGDTTNITNALTIDYTKVIPYGRLLSGVNAARSETDNSGQANVINEPHLGVQVPGPFTLDQPNADPNTIIVFLKSPLPPFQLIQLVQNVNYTIIPVENTFQIFVTSLPPEFQVPGTYDFFVDYSLTGGNYKLRTDTYGGNASVQLFEDLLTPYFSYESVQSSVVSGTFPGTPFDSEVYTTGLLYHQGPLRVRGQYQDLKSNLSPYQAWLADAQYVDSLNDTTYVYATTAYQNKHFPKGTSGQSTGQFAVSSTPFTEQTESIAATIQKQFFARNMSVSAGGTYSRYQGLVDSNSYSVNANWLWTIGKVDLTAGVTAYGSDTTSAPKEKRDHQTVYVNFRRRLF
jgi:hypothetical protein